jgi:glycosyltransferase involved in cell wall biosynthesis
MICPYKSGIGVIHVRVIVYYFSFLCEVTMEILFLIPYPIKEAPSQRFRFEQYHTMLSENGFQISHQSFWDEASWSILYKRGFAFQKTIGFLKGVGSRLLLLFKLSKPDFVFIHRECLPIGPPVVEWFIARVLKKKIIYDFDDAIWLPNTSEENRLVGFLKWHTKVSLICRWSYRVSCGNSFLADYARKFNKSVIVNPTTIDTAHLHNPSLYSINKKSTQVVIGWTGSQSTLMYIKPLIPVLKKLDEKFPDVIRFLVIANKDPQLDLPFADFVMWSKQTEINDLLKIDIGVMPLTNDAWANGKCGFKALQYMALEIPTVVSSVGVNSEIVTNGLNGFLCNTENEWLSAFELLITNPSMRKEMGKAGRKKIEASYSVVSNSSRFIRLFS